MSHIAALVLAVLSAAPSPFAIDGPAQARDDTAPALVVAGLRALSSGDPVAAREHFARARAAHSGAPGMHHGPKTQQFLEDCASLAALSVDQADALRLFIEAQVDVAPSPWFSVARGVGDWHRTSSEHPKRLVHGETAYSVALAQQPEALALAATLEWRGLVRIRLAKHDSAELDLRQARRLYREHSSDDGEIFCVRRLAWNAYLDGRYQTALELLAEQRELLTSSPGPLAPELRDNQHFRALSALHLGDLDEAANALRAQFEIDERLHRRYISEALTLSTHSHVMHGTPVWLLERHVRHNPEDLERVFALASSVVEHARGRALRLFVSGNNGSAEPESDADVHRLRKLSAGVAEVRWFHARSEEGGPECTILLARYRQERVFENLGERADLDRQIDRFLANWLTPASLAHAPGQYAEDARKLAQLVLGSAAAWWTSKTPPRRLIVLADGATEQIPFEALVMDRLAGDAGFRSLPYMVRTTAVIRIPTLALLRAVPSPNGHSQTVALIDPLRPAQSLMNSSPLRFSPAEGELFRSAHPEALVLTRENATLSRLESTLESHEIAWLHLGCHAIQNGPTASLLLAASADGQADVAASTINNLPLTPGVRVVLSACSTAHGDIHRGEGMRGLWRAFLVAGASCVVATARDVDDRSSAAFMAGFYASAADGTPIADAVRQASLSWLAGTITPEYPRGSFVTDVAHPYLWASYVCIGNDGGPLLIDW